MMTIDYVLGSNSSTTSFLRGFSTEQQQQNQTQPQNLHVAPTEPPPKKTVDTFGQRTSIYRSVTW